nr:hypothetical protein [Tanacetum cinerariifolium]
MLAVNRESKLPLLAMNKTTRTLGGVAVVVVRGRCRVVGGCRRWWRLRRGDEGGGWRVVASGVVDRVDQEKGSVFGVRWKSWQEKFFGGGNGGDRWLAGGGRWLENMEWVCV